jgi:hypothetical protein
MTICSRIELNVAWTALAWKTDRRKQMKFKMKITCECVSFSERKTKFYIFPRCVFFNILPTYYISFLVSSNKATGVM